MFWSYQNVTLTRRNETNSVKYEGYLKRVKDERNTGVTIKRTPMSALVKIR